MPILSKDKKNGFTLVELLVTISILSLLAALVMNSFTKLQQKTRDTQRKSDLKVIQSALEQYHADQNYYPVTVVMTVGQNISSPDGTKTYLKGIPQEPKGVNNYSYANNTSGCNNTTIYCQKYCIFTALELPPSPTPAAPSGCTYPNSNYNFYVESP